MRLMTNMPSVPRPLKVFDVDRCLKLLQLGNMLLGARPTESPERTARFLIELSNQNPVAAPVPALRWLSQREPSAFDELVNFEPNRSKPIQALMPQMRFSARLGRR